MKLQFATGNFDLQSAGGSTTVNFVNVEPAKEGEPMENIFMSITFPTPSSLGQIEAQAKAVLKSALAGLG